MLSDLLLGRTLFFLDSETKKPDFCPKNADLPSLFAGNAYFWKSNCTESLIFL
ncbi:hypothetical protein [Brevibacillus brevis]|uniref:hypothetical protein n=1 Tax=Brevibacillus brevis TaxID=1393 RepID=UPI0025A4CED6|nr:hypothetical protein [Brevibacillus brevis]WJQ81639.1 hypothetical protein QN310_30150 [Brevibacillus brevis]